MCKTSSAYVQHVVLHATRNQGTTTLLSLTEFKSYLILLNFIGWNHELMKKGRELEYPEKIPTSFRKCHILKPKNSREWMPGGYSSNDQLQWISLEIDDVHKTDAPERSSSPAANVSGLIYVRSRQVQNLSGQDVLLTVLMFEPTSRKSSLQNFS